MKSKNTYLKIGKNSHLYLLYFKEKERKSMKIKIDTKRVLIDILNTQNDKLAQLFLRKI